MRQQSRAPDLAHGVRTGAKCDMDGKEGRADDAQDHVEWPWLLGSATLCGAATLAGILLQRTGAPPEVALGLYATAYLAGAGMLPWTPWASSAGAGWTSIS